MKLTEVLNYVNNGTKLLITVALDAGTKESFAVEIMRGNRAGGWRKEYLDWLEALNLEVKSLSACAEDTAGNKDMLCIRCIPIRVKK